MWADLWAYYKRKVIIFNVAGVALLVGGISYYVYKSKRSLDSLLPSFTPPVDLILKAFKVGKGFDMHKRKDSPAFVNRNFLYDNLKKILNPEEIDQYAVVVGENGCGKSTAVRVVLSSLPEPRGAVYFDCPANPKQFSVELLDILGYKPSVDLIGSLKRLFERTSKEEKEPDMNLEPMASFCRF